MIGNVGIGEIITLITTGVMLLGYAFHVKHVVDKHEKELIELKAKNETLTEKVANTSVTMSESRIELEGKLKSLTEKVENLFEKFDTLIDRTSVNEQTLARIETKLNLIEGYFANK